MNKAEIARRAFYGSELFESLVDHLRETHSEPVEHGGQRFRVCSADLAEYIGWTEAIPDADLLRILGAESLADFDDPPPEAPPPNCPGCGADGTRADNIGAPSPFLYACLECDRHWTWDLTTGATALTGTVRMVSEAEILAHS
jgi:hypothetical protein